MAEGYSSEKFIAYVRENHAGLRGFVRSLGVAPMWVDDLAQEVRVGGSQTFEEILFNGLTNRCFFLRNRGVPGTSKQKDGDWEDQEHKTGSGLHEVVLSQPILETAHPIRR